jgi:hypothetical protein
MTPYEPPKMQTPHPPNILPMYVALMVCIILALGGIGLSVFGLFRIFVTSPGMGIPVDAQGNRLPVEGYSQLWCGLAVTGIFSIFTLVTGICFHKVTKMQFSRDRMFP